MIIAPGQSIEEVITVRIGGLWEGNVFSRVFQPVCLFTRGGPYEIGQMNAPPLSTTCSKLFKVVQVGTTLLYYLDTWDGPWTWTYHMDRPDSNLLASGRLAFD